MFDITNMDRAGITRLLCASGELQQELFAEARRVRKEHGQDLVTVRGVVEISNFCAKNCDYCAMRRENMELNRYRMNAEQILTLARQIKAQGIPICFLQAGQEAKVDPILEEVIPVVRNELKMGVLLNLGEKRREQYHRYVELGADSYILKFETSSPALYDAVVGTPLEKRMKCMDWIREAGMKLGTGNIVGLPGQTVDMLVDDLLCAVKIKPDFVSSSPFIPSGATPLQYLPIGNFDMTLNTLAILRIALKNVLIPSVSALEKIHDDGQLAGLNAGANILTINFTPRAFQEMFVIYADDRFVVTQKHALETIERAGLRPKRLPVTSMETDTTDTLTGAFSSGAPQGLVKLM